MTRPFLIALQFLTLIPVRLDNNFIDREAGLSLIYYPLVGLFIGVLLLALAWALMNAPTILAAALVLVCWVWVTGGIHLDGLADTADAWVGGLGDVEKTLSIMKDPYCGPAGVVSIVLVLLIKFAAIHAIISGDHLALILIAPVLGRTVPPALFLSTPYVRPRGIGSAIAANVPVRPIIIVCILVLASVFIIFDEFGIWHLLTSLGMFVLLRAMAIRRIGGTTGDVVGALTEIMEAVILISIVLSL